MPTPALVEARRLLLGGRVQGVGFRPFVYRIAHRHRIVGTVRNIAGQVEIFAQGDAGALHDFAAALIAEAPPSSRPEILSMAAAPLRQTSIFSIDESLSGGSIDAHTPPDQFVCDPCRRELDDPSDRRWRYPFINCTQCGPRYTLIERLPYDRVNTTMAAFSLCEECAKEYRDPLDRRFHAEPIACPECGPSLTFVEESAPRRQGEAAIAACVAALRSDQVVAVKGVGGYHLVCAAASATAVDRLRQRKHRPDKPLAVMFRDDGDFADLHRAVTPTAMELELLRDPIRPIVLIPKKRNTTLVADIAPGCHELGVMLPYSPLHHLLLGDFNAPLVATSANLSGEPVLTDNREVEERLGTVADSFLHNDRPIARPADDSVFRFIAGKGRPLRLGRGAAPVELDLPFALPHPVLALGGWRKNTIAIGWGRRAVVSPHLGDMESPRAQTLRDEVAANLQTLYGIAVESLVCDAHPGLAVAESCLPMAKVFHHEAHASALVGETGLPGDWLVFSWDGVGFGKDGSLWGGESFVGAPGHWRRFSSFRPFSLPGGDRAAREPWRCAAALLWETGRTHPSENDERSLVFEAWKRRVNCPRTSSIGRLFDAAAALLGLISEATFEAQAAMLLEAAANAHADPMDLPLACAPDGVWRSDWEPLLDRLQNSQIGVAARASLFHASLAAALLAQAELARSQHGIARLGLTGGVFQNRRLCELVVPSAEKRGFSVFLHERIPCNDAGLSYGQLVETGARECLKIAI